MTKTEEKLIAAGIDNLVEFGYPREAVTAESIISDYVYSKMFEGMLIENRGHGRAYDEAIDSLLAKIESAREAGKGGAK